MWVMGSGGKCDPQALYKLNSCHLVQTSWVLQYFLIFRKENTESQTFEFEQTPGDIERWEILECFSTWGPKELHTTDWPSTHILGICFSMILKHSCLWKLWCTKKKVKWVSISVSFYGRQNLWNIMYSWTCIFINANTSSHVEINVDADISIHCHLSVGDRPLNAIWGGRLGKSVTLLEYEWGFENLHPSASWYWSEKTLETQCPFRDSHHCTGAPVHPWKLGY